MTRDRWQRIEQLYHSALEREATQRSAFLSEACAGDDALRQEVESLLAQERGAQGFLEAPALEVAAKIFGEDQGPSLVGRQLGSYWSPAMPAEAPNDKLIRSLVERALAQPSGERESFIRRDCGGDPALFEQVWNYVRWEERMKGFLVDPLFHPRDGKLPASSTITGLNPGPPPGFTPGTVLDQRYRIVNLLGR